MDTRDARPLFYDGRLLTAAGVKEGEHCFKDVPIMQGVVQAAKMLKSSQMQTVNDCSDEALPVTTDVDGTIQGAAKFQQLGTDAWCKIMDACTDGMNFTDRGALLVFEINFGVGNGFDAFLEKKKGLRVPAFYSTILPDVKTSERFTVTKTAAIKELALEQGLSVPGCAPVCKGHPVELLEAMPDQPRMNRVVATAPVAA